MLSSPFANGCNARRSSPAPLAGGHDQLCPRNMSPPPPCKRVRPASLVGEPLDPSAVASSPAADRGCPLTADVTALWVHAPFRVSRTEQWES